MARRLTAIDGSEASFLSKQVYDLAIFASGYETRARAVAQQVPLENLSKVLVLGFPDGRDEQGRIENDRFFKERFNQEIVVLESGAPAEIAEIVQSLCGAIRDELRILVDISAMSRSWYADILNWARFSVSPRAVDIEFVYCHGLYPSEYPARHISDTVSLFGYEGRTDPRLETVALIGLGFDAVTPMAVLEDLQPEYKYGFVASSSDDTALTAAVEKNMGTVEQLDGPLAVVPLASVPTAFRLLTEMVGPHIGARNVVFVCLGPKTHVLASLLVSICFEEVTCLHAKGGPAKPLNIMPSSEITKCNVRFETFDAPASVGFGDQGVNSEAVAV